MHGSEWELFVQVKTPLTQAVWTPSWFGNQASFQNYFSDVSGYGDVGCRSEPCLKVNLALERFFSLKTL